MLSIGPMSGGQSHYYTHLAREDYYLAGGEPPGHWYGKGAERLNLTGQVSGEQLGLLFDGFSPTGQPLVQNAGTDKRRPGFDLTFSAPKSVSVLWAVARTDVRQEIQRAQRDAVQAALDFLQDEAGFIRTGKGGVNFHKAGIVAALFEHGTSRALDPQLHTHALLLNMGVTDDMARALVHTKFFDLKMLAGAIYRAELAAQLERRLGLVIERDHGNGFGFVVKGVKESLVEFFSKRRAEIEELLGTADLETARAAEFAAKETRKTKDHVPSRSELFSGWGRNGEEYQFTAEEAHGLLGKAPQRAVNQEREAALTASLQELSRSESHFSRAELGATIAEQVIGRGLGAKTVRELLDQSLASDKRLVKLGQNTHGEERFTQKETQDKERELLKSVDALADRNHGVKLSIRKDILLHYREARSAISAEMKYHVSGLLRSVMRESTDRIDRDAVRKAAAFKLSPEQADAVSRLTARRAGAIRCLEGDAGTGKTTTLGVAREIWEKAGYKVMGVCLAGKATEELRKGAGIKSFTYAKFTWLLDKGPDYARELKHHATQFWRAARGKKTFQYDHDTFQLDKKTVLVVDEAGMMDTAQIARLLKEAEKAGAMVVLSGDRKQLQAIGAGGAFAYIADQVGKAELKTIIRQRDVKDRQVVTDLSAGDAEKALKELSERGLLKFGDNRRQSLGMLVDDWLKFETHQKPGQSLIFANTHAEVDEINRRCQEGLARAGKLGKESININGWDIHRNDRVLMTTPGRRFGVNNGDTGTVVSFNRSGRSPSVTVQIDGGGTAVLPVAEYDGIELGYAVTTHKGQGSTVDRAYVLAGGRMQSREISYVQVSRTREPARVYATSFDDKEKVERLAHAMSRSQEKTLAQSIADRNRDKAQEEVITQDHSYRQRLRREK